MSSGPLDWDILLSSFQKKSIIIDIIHRWRLWRCKTVKICKNVHWKLMDLKSVMFCKYLLNESLDLYENLNSYVSNELPQHFWKRNVYSHTCTRYKRAHMRWNWLLKIINFQCILYISTVLHLQSLQRWIISETLWNFLETRYQNVPM